MKHTKREHPRIEGRHGSMTINVNVKVNAMSTPYPIGSHANSSANRGKRVEVRGMHIACCTPFHVNASPILVRRAFEDPPRYRTAWIDWMNCLELNSRVPRTCFSRMGLPFSPSRSDPSTNPPLGVRASSRLQRVKPIGARLRLGDHSEVAP
jgi:hypothetical protein